MRGSAQEHAEGAGSEGPASAADAAPSASDGAQLPPEASSAVLISRENLERVVLKMTMRKPLRTPCILNGMWRACMPSWCARSCQ